MIKSQGCGLFSHRMNGFLILSMLLPMSLMTSPVRATRMNDVPTTSTWVTDGPVYAIAQASNTLYLGGDFNQVGPATGNFVPVDTTTGHSAGSFPKVIGKVYACVADGVGGWYIGGAFSQVGNLTRNNIAHILADGSVDAAWNPNAGSEVDALALDGGTLYAGGQFGYIGGRSVQYIAALDADSTGSATALNLQANNPVYAMAVADGKLYIGGDFSKIGGQYRGCLVALDLTSGTIMNWNPAVDMTVRALAVADGTVYVGGEFVIIDGQERPRLGAVDAASGHVTAWAPQVSGGDVLALAVMNGVVYAGGNFTSIGGQTRLGLAAVDTASGAVTAWNPNVYKLPILDPAIYALAAANGTVYAGGVFTQICGQDRNGLAALDASSGALKAWNPKAGNTVYALTLADGTLGVGGNFATIGGQIRHNLAAIDASSGAATAWNPNASGYVNALAVSGGTVYAGGTFYQVGGQTRPYLAALNSSSGAVTGWNPNANEQVKALAISGSTVYAGGWFSSIGGQTRNRIAALNASSGAATAWNPHADDYVDALAVSGSTVYAGGRFVSIGGQARNHLAALDATSGAATAWNPNPNGWVHALMVSGSTVYVGGGFTTIGGTGRYYLAALDCSSGAATSWYPNPALAGSSLGVIQPSVYALALSSRMVYAAGNFTPSKLNGPSQYVTEVTAASGAATLWRPKPDGMAYTLAQVGGTLYAGGDFTIIGGQAQAHFARFDTLPTPTAPINPGITSITTNNIIWSWTDTSDVETNFKIWFGSGATPKTMSYATANTTSWVSYYRTSPLSANTQYSFQVAATDMNDDSAPTAILTAYTLAYQPTAGKNVSAPIANRAVRPLGTTFVFTNPAGFGVGTHPVNGYKASAFNWAWDEASTHTFDATEAQWNSGELSLTPTHTGSYYLHLQSVNAEGVTTPQTLDLGPFNVMMSNGVRKWEGYR